ncbi:MAG TPA: beta-propeller domain-containing protein, partial [Kofleriaceae bacterium]
MLGACSADSDTPSDHVLARTTELHQYNSCSALEADLKQVLIQQAFADIDNADQYGLDDAGAEPTAGGANGGSQPGRTEGTDYSGTNNQEQGVDEADLVKTDGYHLYTLSGHQLQIFGTPNFGDLVPESTTNLEGYPREMLIDAAQNRMAVFSMIDVYSLPDGHPLKQLVGWQDDAWYWRISQLTKITVLDISDRTHPSLVREVYFEGWYDTARKVDNTVRMAAYSWLDLPWASGWYQYYWNNGRDKDATKHYVAQRINRAHLDDMIPEMYVRTPDGHFVTNTLSTNSCQQFYRPSDSHARGISTIISFDMLGNDFFYDADHVVSNYPTFYESQNRLVIAESAHDYWWYYWFQDDPPQTNVHVFDSSQSGKSSYIGSGRIDGSILDQFSIDEQDGNIRLAATTGGWWHFETQTSDPVENHIYVLSPDGIHYK